MKNKKVVSIISTVLFLIIIIGASFAYLGSFTEELENNVAVNIYASNLGNSSFIATSADMNIQVPLNAMFEGSTGVAASDNATITVNLTGAPNILTTCTYDVVYEYDLNSEIYGSTVAVTSGATKEITMQVDSPSGTNNFSSETNFNYNSSWTAKTSTVGAKRTLVKGATITSMGTSTLQTITVTGKYYNLNVNQDNLANKHFTGKIYVENNSCSAGEMPKSNELILLNNGGKKAIEAKGKPTFTTSATTNEGMYATKDDYGTSYYFRGAVDNNWLKFGEVGGKPIYWRIIRINGDGSIRLLYTGTTAPTESQKVVMTGTGTQISTSAFNEEYDKTEYVGYKYEVGKQHGLAKNSTIKTTLENWYKTTTLYTDEATSKLVADTPFCYDRSASTSEIGTYGEIDSWVSTGTYYYYGSYGRTWGNNNSWNPSLKCQNELDKYSVANGTLENPVGLITADEIVLAGGKNTGNSLQYLYTNQYYWSGSPYFFFSYNSVSVVFNVSSSGALNNSSVSDLSGVRPSISLSSEAKLSGDGTWNNPYTVNLS